MKRKKEVLAIAGIATLIVSIILIVGLIVVNLVGEVGIGNKITGLFTDKQVNNDKKQVISIEEIPYEEIRYYPFEGENKLWGYVDSDFNIVISPQFISAEVFTNGLGAIVTENGNGYVDKSGEMVIQDKYFYGEPFSDGVALVSEEYKSEECLIINLNGEILGRVDKKYDCYSFEDGTAIISKGEKEGLINKNGDIILEVNNEMINSPVNGIRLVSKSEGKDFYVDSTGEVLGGKYYYYGSDFINGYALVEDKNDNTSVINKHGEEVNIPSDFNVVSISSEGIIVSDKNTFNDGLIGYDGKVILKAEFDDLSKFNDGLAFARVSSDDLGYKLCALNNKGEIIFALENSDEYYSYEFSMGVSIISDLDNNNGVINLKGEFIIPMTEGFIIQDGKFIQANEGPTELPTSRKLYNLKGELLYEGSGEIFFSNIDGDVIKVKSTKNDSEIMINKDGKQLKIK